MTSASERRTLIVFFHPGHPNHVQMLQYVQPALTSRGFTFVDISFRDPTALARLAHVLCERSDEIFCFYSMNYYIKELALRNLWSAAQDEFKHIDGGELYLHQITRVPLVVHIYDHPLLLLKHESAAFDGAIVFVNGDDIIDFMQKYCQSKCTYIPIPVPTETHMPALIPSLNAPTFDNFLGRRNEVWCPINLSTQNLSVDGIWNHIKGLPIARRDRAIRLVEAALYDCVTPIHVVSERLTAAGDPEILLADQLHVFNFIKLWRRTKMIRALIDLPILVSSDFVPADLARKYPQKFTDTSMAQTLLMYERFRFSLNCFPPHNDALHDRVINPFFANSVLVSDRNALATRLFKDGVDLVFLDYDMPDMSAKLQAYLADPALAYQITVNRYERRLEREQLMASGDATDGLCDALIDAIKAKWEARNPVARM